MSKLSKWFDAVKAVENNSLDLKSLTASVTQNENTPIDLYVGKQLSIEEARTLAKWLLDLIGDDEHPSAPAREHFKLGRFSDVVVYSYRGVSAHVENNQFYQDSRGEIVMWRDPQPSEFRAKIFDRNYDLARELNK